jgi:hypothetical protein
VASQCVNIDDMQVNNRVSTQTRLTEILGAPTGRPARGGTT